ncbi:MAG: universal stress protein [Ilumatobacter sp.]|nr:universal stress protein [Ilumatobacter sp.]
MYHRIVVGTDGSERSAAAIEHAASLAQLTDASLHLVQGCGSPVVTASVYAAPPPGSDPRSIVEANRAELQPLADSLAERGLDVSLHVVPTGGHDAICDVAEAIDADLIVVGSRGMTGARRLLGSIPNSVAHHACCSVLIVQTDD